MNWYKKAQIDTPAFPITQQEVQSALNRTYEKNKFYLDDMDVSRRTFFSKEYQDQLENILWSDSELYYRYFRNIPENITIEDILTAYFNNQLPTTKQDSYKPQPINMGNAPESISTMEYQNLPYVMSNEEIKDSWATANLRANKQNSKEVYNARYKIFTQWMTNKDLPNILDIELKEINRKIKIWSGVPQKSVQLHELLNKDVPEQVQWNGIVNSSFLGEKEFSHEEMKQFVGLIELPDLTPELLEEWHGKQGRQLRNVIMRTLKAIDTNISYKNLGVVIENINARGRYEPLKRRIQLKDIYGDTIPHEIGHYLDHKWAEEALEDSYKFSYTSSILLDHYKPYLIKNPVRRQFMEKIHHFILQISEKSDISSEYRQDRGEVFARFVAKFVEWTQKQAGIKWHPESDFNDNFNEYNFSTFVRLLQEKAYVDLVDPPRVPAIISSIQYKGE